MKTQHINHAFDDLGAAELLREKHAWESSTFSKPLPIDYDICNTNYYVHYGEDPTKRTLKEKIFAVETITKQGSIIKKVGPPMVTKKEFKLIEKLELECIKEQFLRNKVRLQGRRRAVTDVDEMLGNQKTMSKIRNSKFRLAFLREIFTKWISSKEDDWDLEEIRRIVAYNKKKRLSL